MGQSTSRSLTSFTPRASLAALGCYMQQIDLLAPIRDQVRIAHKTITHTPLDKVSDAFNTILAGAQGLVETNSRRRTDPVLQQAFGRTACAEQSTIQATLNACTAANVQQLTSAVTAIYRQHSQGYRHDYQRQFQLLDADMTGLPGGPKAALATKGYFPKQRNRRGRQLGRMLASRYGEVLVDQLYGGTTQLTRALRPLIEAAEQVLELDAAKRARTILRVDAGGGSLDDITWVLARGYQLHTKDFSSARARRLAASVAEWLDDPHIPGRQVGWVDEPPTDYVREVRPIAVRWRTKKGHWRYAIVISTLLARVVVEETGLPLAKVLDHQAVTLAYVRLYDQRGGGVEMVIKDDKQGLGTAKRNKKRFEAQQKVILLGTLAHNVLIWARRWLAPHEEKLRRYGLKRLVRDIFHISGRITRNSRGQIVQIVVNQAAPLVGSLARSFDVLLRPRHLAVSWGET